MSGRVFVTETVLGTLRELAEASRPLETGGVLVGVLRDDEPWVVAVIEIAYPFRTSSSYVIPHDATPLAVDVARERDGRLGYLGDWHSHPATGPASHTHRPTLRRNARRRKPRPVPTLLFLVRDAPDGWEIDAMEDDAWNARPIEVVLTGSLAVMGE